MKRKLFAALLAVLMLLCIMPASFTSGKAESGPIDQPIVQGGAILHCFDWSYNEIRAALPQIAQAGYTAVQTSPVQQPKDYNIAWTDGGQWWKLYQPMGLRIAPSEDGAATSWLGTKEELTRLCTEAEQYGLYVIVDIVANHLANISGGGGWEQVNPDIDPELYNEEYFHAGTDAVSDTSRYTMTQNQMGMPDLNTANEFVQQKVYGLLKECVDCGVDGFRFDAAKHIELPNDPGCGSDFWPAILNGDDTDGEIEGIRPYAASLGRRLFIYGESLSGSGSDSWVNEYVTYMALTDSQAGNNARYAAIDRNAGALAVGTYTRGSSPRDYVIWAESHDTYEDGSSSGVSSDTIVKTWAIVGARADSTSLYFARPNETMGLASADTAWSSDEVADVNKFKQHFDGTGEYLSFDQEAQITCIERGTNGAVISCLGSAGSVDLPVYRMADGTYTDQVTGNAFTVINGRISGTVGQGGVAVVYNADEPAKDGIDASELYLVPTSAWDKDGAWFAMYFFNHEDGSAWVRMTPEGDGSYSGAVPEGKWDCVIFCRMSNTASEPGWDSGVWNQTADLVPPPGSDTYTITSQNSNGKYDGYWSRRGAAGYYLVGNMTGWAPAAAYQLTKIEGSSPVEYEITADLTTSSQFKIAYSEDGVSINDADWYPTGWGNNYGENGEMTANGRYHIRFRPNLDGGEDWFYNCILVEESHEHDWSGPVYVWAADNSACTATRTCDCGETETETVETSYEVTTEPTTTTTGVGVYTAEFENEAFETQTKEVEIPMLPIEGYQIHVVDYTKGKATTNIAEGELYSGVKAVTVTCEYACAVVLKTGDGTYTMLPHTLVDGVHTFMVDVTEGEATIAIMIRGDADLSGSITARDATYVKQIAADMAVYTYDEQLHRIAADANKSDSVTAKDATLIKQFMADLAEIGW